MTNIIAMILVIVEITTAFIEIPVAYASEPVRMRVTCYTWTGNRTASGCYPYEGICAGRREDIGKIALVYTEDEELIGIFEIKDCGGAKSLKNGTSIDIYRDTLDRCHEWVHEYGDYLYVRIVE